MAYLLPLLTLDEKMKIDEMLSILEAAGISPHSYFVGRENEPVLGSNKLCLAYSSSSFRVFSIGDRGELHEIEKFPTEERATVKFMKMLLSSRGAMLRWIGATPDKEKTERIDEMFYSNAIPYFKRKGRRGGSDQEWFFYHVVGPDYRRASTLIEEFDIEWKNE